MLSFTDQLGHIIHLPDYPKRIVSVVPSQTELLYALGLQEEVVGITRFCIHPEQWFREKIRVGGTKQLHIDKIHALQPDLIIANKEENTRAQINELSRQYPVWISDVCDLDDASAMILQVGSLIGKESAASQMVNTIRHSYSQLELKDSSVPTAVYLIWNSPFMTVGGDTFIHAQMKAAGFDNLFARSLRYPEVTVEDLQSLQPEFLLLSSEPFPFQQKHIDELQPLLPATRIILVDGEYFSWYGSRLLKAVSYFTALRKKLAADS